LIHAPRKTRQLSGSSLSPWMEKGKDMQKIHSS
jgi:hypothetical protein